jgi:hypothetical protein
VVARAAVDDVVVAGTDVVVAVGGGEVGGVVVGAAVEGVVVSGTEVEVVDDVDVVDELDVLVLVVVSGAGPESFERAASTMITAATSAASTTAATSNNKRRRPSSPAGPNGPAGPPGPDGPRGATAGIRRVGSPPTVGGSTVGSKSSSDAGPLPGGTLPEPIVRRRYRRLPAAAPDQPRPKCVTP